MVRRSALRRSFSAWANIFAIQKDSTRHFGEQNFLLAGERGPYFMGFWQNAQRLGRVLTETNLMPLYGSASL